MRALERYGLAALLVAFLLLGVVYDLATPIFEKPDEAQHFFYVVHLARGRGLPNHNEAEGALWAQEGSQPPLYYALASLLVRPLDLSQAERLARRNPHAAIGIPTWPSNKNVYLHPPGEETLGSPEVLAVRLSRWLSLAAGLVTVWAVWRLAREALAVLAPAHATVLAWGATALVALSPQFLFVSSAVSNDALTAAAATVALWLLVRATRAGLTRREAGILAISSGAAALAKVSGLLVLPFGLAVLGVTALVRRRRLPAAGRLGPLPGALLMAAGVLILAGWWYARNWWLYGDPTGFAAMVEVAGARSRPPSWSRLRWEFSGLLISYWALFGWFNILADEWAYRILNGVMLVGALGLPIAAVRYARRRLRTAPGGASEAGPSRAPARDSGAPAVLPALILLAWVLAVFLALFRWTQLTTGSQGRLLFPAIGAVAILLVAGVTAWLPSRWWRPGLVAGSLILGTWTATLPARVIAPAYALPPRLPAGSLPAGVIPLGWHYGPVRLLGYTLNPAWVDRSTPFDLTLFWQTDRPLAEDYSVGVKLFGRDRAVIAREDSYPGRGLYPTSFWQPGIVVEDRHRLWVSGEAERPVAGFLWVDLYDLETLKALPVTDASGQPVGAPAIARLKVAPREVAGGGPATPAELVATLNGEVALARVELASTALRAGEPLSVTLAWRALQRPRADYTVFVHLVPETGPLQPLAQVDRQPLGGEYPTSFWAAGEVVTDTLRLDFPPDLDAGRYRLLAGLYHLETQQRLPVAGGGDSILLADLQFNGSRWEIAAADRSP